MRLGLVYLLDADIEASCVRYARTLAAASSPRAVVGVGARPHVTLVHVESDDDPARFWREAGAAVPSSVGLEFLSVGLLRYDTPYNAPASAPATMAWLIVPCTQALRDAEQKALALPFVAGASVTTSNGDLFQPHVTLAIWEGEDLPRGAMLPKEILAAKGVSGRLALGVIGPNGTYERSLFET